MVKTTLTISIDIDLLYMLYEKRDKDGLIISRYIEELIRRDLGLSSRCSLHRLKKRGTDMKYKDVIFE